MRSPMLLDLPHPRRPHDTGDVAASVDDERDGYPDEPRLTLYASSHSRSGRPRFVGPAPRQTWREWFSARLTKWFGKEAAQ